MKQFLLILAFLAFAIPAFNQDTFSIVAVDTITGEIGSAGASCLDDISFPGSGGAIIISDILPGRGAIHTQSFWNATNQANARLKMEEGLSPQEVLDWLKVNGVGGIFGAQQRQYGIVDFDPASGQPRSAAFTGTSCLDWKGHRTGTTYSIQGNILLGPGIVDSMEARFLAATGTLADRLMAALQGANVVGADTRCTDNGTSSLSAFLRVAKPTDADSSLYLDLNVPSLPAGTEPIDSLQNLYNQWLVTAAPEPVLSDFRIYPNPAKGFFSLAGENLPGRIGVFNLNGDLLFSAEMNVSNPTFRPNMPAGVYFVRMLDTAGHSTTRKLVWLGSK